MSRIDVAVIGGGIVGLATALSLVERHRKTVVLLEAEAELAFHQTGHNSGVIHSGLYYRPGSKRALLCRKGLVAMYRFCDAEGIPVLRTGKLVVASSQAELSRLDALEQRGRENSVDLRRLRSAELTEYEPSVSGVGGLWVSETGIVSYHAVSLGIAARFCRQGGTVRLGSRVLHIRREAGAFAIETALGSLNAQQVVNCAGLQADRVAHLAGLVSPITIVPFRGEYYTIRPERGDLVRGLIYPVPDPALPFLGVHFTRRITGEVEAGPNAVLALSRYGYRWSDVRLRDIGTYLTNPGFWRMAATHWRTGISEVRRSLSRERFLRSLQVLVPSMQESDLGPGGSGVRAQAVDRQGRLLDDFLLLEAPGQVHVLNAPSPAATASLAIGEEVASRLAAQN